MRMLKNRIKKQGVELLAIQESIISGDVVAIIKLFWPLGNFGFCQLPVIGHSGACSMFGVSQSLQLLLPSLEMVISG